MRICVLATAFAVAKLQKANFRLQTGYGETTIMPTIQIADYQDCFSSVSSTVYQKRTVSVRKRSFS